MSRFTPFSQAALVAAALIVSGCSGGSGNNTAPGGVAPPVLPPPDPTPIASTPDSGSGTPATPPPEENWTSGGVTFDSVRAQQILTSAEFRGADANCIYANCASSGAPAVGQSQAFELHNLHTALSSGITGANSLVAVVDTGFRVTHQEFSGKNIRTHGVLPSANHGTHVASLIAGVKDGKGMHGVAPGADLHLTAINPSGGTNLDLANVTSGTQNAATLGAVAQNNSWGFDISAAAFEAHLQANPGRTVAQGLNSVVANYGSANWQAYLDALHSFQQGGVVVWALSNDDSMTSGDLMAALPHFDQRLEGAWIAAANGYFEVDGAGEITKAVRLSAACGLAASFCIAGDGTTTAANAASDTGYSAGTGTSYVAPQIAGTIALLAEAFPDLTPEEWTKRVLASADNSWFQRLGVATSGTSDFGNGVTHAFSDEWGHGVLDIAAALSPIGSVSFLSGGHVLTSPRAALSDSIAVTPHSFGDALETSLAGTDIAVFDALNRSFAVQGSHLVTPAPTPILPDLIASVSTAPGARSGPISLSSDAMGLLDPTSNMRSGRSSVFSMVGENVAFSSTQSVGVAEITAAGFAGETAIGQNGTYGGGLNLSFGDASRVSVGVSYFGAENSLLGLERSAMFDWGKASAAGTVHLGLDHQLAPGATVFGRLETGAASAMGESAGVVASVGSISFSGFQIGASFDGVLTSDDVFSISMSQPLRIEEGTMLLNVPTGRSANGDVQVQALSTDLAPTARQLDLALDYSVPVATGALKASVSYQINSGHTPGRSAFGGAVRFGRSY